jgi:hypothetical protein
MTTDGGCTRGQQQKIWQEVVGTNLNQETMGKEAVLCEDGKLCYPVHVSYDMGWQKSSKTYDSLSGHGLMIGFPNKKGKLLSKLFKDMHQV